MPKQQTNGTPSQVRDREILEEVLGPHMAAFAPVSFMAGYRAINIASLASQAIIIPVEVDHIISPFRGEPATRIGVYTEGFTCPQDTYVLGHHGIPGKGYAIIVSGEKDEG